MNNVKIDKAIIRKLVQYGKKEFDSIKFVNCNLYNADIKDFKNRQSLDHALKNDDDTLLQLIIIYSFERKGFDEELKSYKKGSDYNGKIKSHPISVLIAFKKTIEKFNVDDVNSLAKYPDIDEIAKFWFDKIIENHFGNFNKRNFNEKNITSFIKFFKNNNAQNLRKFIQDGKLNYASSLLQENIKGVGPKIANLITRDLLITFSEENKEEKFPQINRKEIGYALPIDIWVRRCVMAIPLLGDKVIEKLKRKHFINDINKIVDNKIRKVIIDECLELDLNPFLFEFGSYLFGNREISNKKDIEEIYSILKEKLYQKN